MMRFRYRKTVRIGPIRLHFTQNGFSSWAVKIGPWTWNATTGRHTINTPGPGAFHTTPRRTNRRTGGHRQ